MDVSMPVLDGFEATREIRAGSEDTRVLMLTGSNSRADVDRSREAGASGYVTKDRIASELVAAIVEVTRATATLSACSRSSQSPRCSSSSRMISLILMHSGRDAGMGGLGFTPTSQGGTHIVERNLTRVTVVVAVLFFANSIALFHYLK